MTARYAVYYAPAPDTPLWRFGSEVIGYDAAKTAMLPQPGKMPAENWPALTEEPRRYGFHGTLKAPFSLADTASEADLLASAASFAASRAVFAVPYLHVATLGSFVALVPRTPAPALHDLADECVRAFEPFRAPLSPADRERRLRSRLSERQIGHLDAWGYPNVFEDFRFHMTLTGPLPPDLQEPVRAALAKRYAALEPGLTVDAITLFKQDDRAGRFRVLERFAFGG